jgi:type IV secretory pathway TraG/TraD family ATPase VirD4
VYNIFEEVDEDGPRGEDEFDEMAEILFREHRHGSRNVFFPDAASNLLGGLLRYLYREGKRCGLQPDNRELLDFVRRFDQEEAYELLSDTDEDGDPVYPDLQGAAGTITPNARKQTAGVYTTLRLVLERTFGTGDLGRLSSDGETVSIRKYMEEPDGRILLLDFPIAESERVKPAFRFFLHRAIKFGLRDRGQAYYVLDEFARIPNVTNMAELVDTGRAQNAQAILGLQSISQLDAEYGDLVGDALRSGMLYELHLRSGDRRTVDYVRHRLGGDVRVTESVGDERGPGHARSATRPARTALIQGLDDGEGFFVTPQGQARVSLPMYSELDPATRRALSGRGTRSQPNRRDGVAPSR